MPARARIDITLDSPFPGLELEASAFTNASGTFVQPRLTISGMAEIGLQDVPALVSMLTSAAGVVQGYSDTLCRVMGLPSEEVAAAQGNSEAQKNVAAQSQAILVSTVAG